MADNKEFDSIDDLFRKSFDNLPETPSANGWDTPSDRVWGNINQVIGKSGGLNGATTAMIVAGALIAVLSLVYFTNRTTQKPVETAPTTIQEPPVVTTPANPHPPAINQEEKTAVAPVKKRLERKPKAVTSTPSEAPPTQATMPPAPTPQTPTESHVKPPNSVEKRKMENARNGLVRPSRDSIKQ